MKNSLTVFKNDLFEIAVKLENGETIFDLETVAISLGITQEKFGVKYVRWERVNEYLKTSFSTSGEKQIEYKKGDMIPEPAVYKLAFKASNEVAEKFQNWLAIEVLPSIRKFGLYATEELLNDPDLLISALQNLKEEREQKKLFQEQNRLLQSKIDMDEPKVIFADMMAESKELTLFSNLANTITQKGVPITLAELTGWCIEDKLIKAIKENGTHFPTKKGTDLKLFEVVPFTHTSGYGKLVTTYTTKVTQKGVQYITDKIVKERANKPDKPSKPNKSNKPKQLKLEVLAK